MATSFNKLNSLDPNTVMIVDALNLAFRYMREGSTEFMDKYIQTVESLRRSYKASKVIIACDQGSSSYRKSIYPLYKANRTEKYANQTAEEEAKFEAFFKEFNRVMDVYVEGDDYPMLRFDKCEADDIGAYVTRKATKKGYKVWLMSSDGDWDLMIADNVSRFSYVTRKEITLDNWNEHYEYDVDDHISIKCLTGDSGDNIFGVPGIGPKKAHALVREFGSTYDIIASMPLASRYKHIANLNDFGAEALLLNYKLMDLVTHCDEALGPANCATIDAVLERYL